MNVHALKLCLVTNLQNQSFQSYESFLLKAIKGGITSVQLRAKNKNLLEFRELALQLKKLLSPFRIPLIINDHVEIAQEIDADGVHIGQSDYAPHEARKILGASKILGWSIETLADLEAANQLTCIDYVGASAVFPSKTKLDCHTIWGLSGLEIITKLSRHPVVAIGGIQLTNVRSVMECGACGVAVVDALHCADPQQSANDLIAEINDSIQKREQYV